MLRMLAKAGAGLIIAALVSGPSALGQQYPDRPINVIVPFPPGAVDAYIRFVQPFVEKQLGQPLVVQNRGGANGALGTEAVARSKPDGHTLLFNVTSSAVMAPLTMGNARFDIAKDFVPITDFVHSTLVLVVRSSLPVKNLDELMAYARANPGKLNFGSPGSGSSLHLIGASFAKAVGSPMTHIPYKGFAPEMQALVSGELDMGFIGSGTVLSHVQSGALRAIAMAEGPVTTGYPPLPDLTKVLSGYDYLPIFSALWVPAGTPKEIVQRLNAVMMAALRDPEVRKKFEDLGMDPRGRTLEETAKAVADNVAVATKLVNEAKAAGVKFDD